VVHRQDQALRRLRSVQEGMPLSQLPRQVYQEGARRPAVRWRATRRWSSRRPITGATSGGSYSSRRRRERASWTVGVSCVCSSGAICKRAGAMADANRPHAPPTHRSPDTALRKKIAPALEGGKAFLSLILVILVLRSAHLAVVVVEHQRCLDHVRERRHLHVAAGRAASQILKNLSKNCLCE
jgi:hypothetical protein